MTHMTDKSGLQVVIGLGQSGLSAVNFLIKEGYNVAVTDGNVNPPLATKLPDAVKICDFGGINEKLLLKASRIIISPGISLNQPAVAQAINAGISVVCDIQLFHEALSQRDCYVPIVAITGSNAKSTVTTLLGNMAKDAGINVGIGGNIGVPALTLLADPTMELAVLELSSFQLETISDLNAQVVTVLNMSPDHLDRHGDMDGYQLAKHRIFQGAKSVVINRDDALTEPLTSVMDNILIEVSIGSDASESLQYGLLTDRAGQVYLARGNQKLLNTSELKVKGQHNQMNALAALALGELVDLPIDSMLTTLTQFTGLEHRCQFIKNINGVDYFNDSKGTNIGSTMAAIKGLGESYCTTDANSKIVLILGGQSKDQDFSEMTYLINKYVSHVLFIGEDATVIEQQLVSGKLSESVHHEQVATLDVAVKTAKELASGNSQIRALLLSPACASFDQFVGYEKRGERFVELVTAL